ncbi:MAG TPA: hypothetical protein VK988_09890 [Acidimicrobiales bacterium]|nr:hypothetical protein [Acidimicrobiales bacterium]
MQAVFLPFMFLAVFLVSGWAAGTIALLGGAMGLAMGVSALSSWERLIYPIRWILPGLVGLGVGAFGSLLVESSGTEDFYAAAAQIIPVLLLGLAIESRSVRLRRVGNPLDAAFALLVIVGFLGFGEFRAMKALAGTPDRNDFISVWAALMAGFLAVTLNALTPSPPSLSDDDGERRGEDD